MTGALESSGIQSGNIVYNMATYMFMAAGAVVIFLLMASLLVFKKFYKLIRAKLVDILKKTFYNNLIKSFNISFLKLTISFSVVVYLKLRSVEEDVTP